MKEQMVNDNEFSLLRLVPTVLRARDFRLYTKNGQRLVDLWQNGGAAILGHTPPSMLRELKNTASRGLYAPFPHFLEARYFKALSRIFPGRNFRLYAAPPPELAALANGDYSEKNSHRGSAFLRKAKAQRTQKNEWGFWRPFLDPAAPLAVPEDAPPVLIPVIPGIQGWRGGLPVGVCVIAITPDFDSTALPPGDFLPPVVLAAAARGLHDLIAAAPERGNPVYPRITKVLKASQSGANRWQRQGVYLTLRQTVPTEEWSSLFNQFLTNGFLLPPIQSQPVILPGVLSPGEEAKLAGLLAE